jgi:hypothetical protein
MLDNLLYFVFYLVFVGRKMKILDQLKDVEAIRVCGTIIYPDLNDPEPKIQIQALRDIPSLEAEGNETSSDVCEVDAESAINFEGLYIERVSWVDNDMFVHFSCPTDIAILAEEITDVSSDPIETPLRCITVTDLSNVQ